MKYLVVLAALALATSPALAQRKPCEELKSEIATKIRNNGVKHFTLEIVPNAEVKNPQQVVGSCDGGTKKITYRRDAPPPAK